MRSMSRNITGSHTVCGVIGNPISHTLSPAIHNTLNDFYQMSSVYVPFKVESEDVAAAINGAHALGIRGLNVTMPHKKAVMPHLVGIDALALQTEAVNTLVYEESGYKGYNTDVEGLKIGRASCRERVYVLV